MQQIAQADLPAAFGTPLAGGFYAGLIRKADQVHAIIVSPKNDGEHAAIKWNGKNSKMVVDAPSFYDGMANTIAMAKAGSSLANYRIRLPGRRPRSIRT